MPTVQYIIYLYFHDFKIQRGRGVLRCLRNFNCNSSEILHKILHKSKLLWYTRVPYCMGRGGSLWRGSYFSNFSIFCLQYPLVMTILVCKKIGQIVIPFSLRCVLSHFSTILLAIRRCFTISQMYVINHRQVIWCLYGANIFSWVLKNRRIETNT